MSRLLIIDDDDASCRTLQLHLRGQDHEVSLAHSVDEGLVAIDKMPPDLIILDIRMPGRDGLQGLREFKELLPEVPVIMITAYHDMDSTIQAMKGRADDYIHKPIDINELDEAVRHAIIRQRADDSEMFFEEGPAHRDKNTMVGRSRVMKEVFKTIGLVAPELVTVLITGESGTGKELVARAIHRSGRNPSGPFVAVNCAALVESLLESELFGHEKGAFTGAVSRQIGKFSLASGGTIFLDEIGALPAAVQAKLLRVLHEREFVPVGGTQVMTTDARVIAATNVDLMECVRQGVFRDDLYYRLKVATIHLAPLRERKEDLVDLVEALLTRINRELRRSVKRLSKDVMQGFHSYHWPGNVRELENMLMKAVVMCPGDTITRDLIPENVYETGGPDRSEAFEPEGLRLKEVEKAHIARVLDLVNWHRGNACEILAISRPRLRRLMRQYGLVGPIKHDTGD
ncbi:MAG: sigma-54 dependent transcriptional regulator [Gammaproteobacteria bacterium]|nr:sigma-54 dependent transcriptional regulator [Gammaproteobacteria bacterium]